MPALNTCMDMYSVAGAAIASVWLTQRACKNAGPFPSFGCYELAHDARKAHRESFSKARL